MRLALFITIFAALDAGSVVAKPTPMQRGPLRQLGRERARVDRSKEAAVLSSSASSGSRVAIPKGGAVMPVSARVCALCVTPSDRRSGKPLRSIRSPSDAIA